MKPPMMPCPSLCEGCAGKHQSHHDTGEESERAEDSRVRRLCGCRDSHRLRHWRPRSRHRRAISEVTDTLKREKIFGGSDMSATVPGSIDEAVAEAGLDPATADLPDCEVYDPAKAEADPEYEGESIDTGDEARCFAQYMRVHALESSGGLVYAEMGRFLAADDPSNPAGTSDPAAAGHGRARATRSRTPRATRGSTETALATALNTCVLRHPGLQLRHRCRDRADPGRHRLRTPRVRGLPQALPPGEERGGAARTAHATRSAGRLRRAQSESCPASSPAASPIRQGGRAPVRAVARCARCTVADLANRRAALEHLLSREPTLSCRGDAASSKGEPRRPDRAALPSRRVTVS